MFMSLWLQILFIDKVGPCGKYGTRYGASTRKVMRRIEVTQHAKVFFSLFSIQ